MERREKGVTHQARGQRKKYVLIGEANVWTSACSFSVVLTVDPLWGFLRVGVRIFSPWLEGRFAQSPIWI